MNFFRTLYQIAHGPSAFHLLLKQGICRAVFHLLFFVFLVSLLSSFFALSSVKDMNREVFEVLEAHFGKILVAQDRVFPEKNTSERKTFILPYPGTRLDYLPFPSREKILSFDSAEENIGILWMPRGFALWQKIPGREKEYLFFRMPHPGSVPAQTGKDGSVMFQPYQQLSAGEMASYLEKHCFLNGKENLKAHPSLSISMHQLEETVSRIFGIAYFFLGAFFPYFSIAFLTTLFFALIQHFASFGPSKLNLSFSSEYAVMIYASFPAILAGALLEQLFSAVSFSTYFFIVFFIFHLCVFASIRKQLSPQEKVPPGNDL